MASAQPFVYEINTWVWLQRLTARYETPIHLGNVPPHEWDILAGYQMDAVWLMGVWERSPEGRRIAIEEAGLEAEYAAALPDYSPADVIGSPYCIHRYSADPALGGPEGLATARHELSRRNLQLILDFVPNHVAPDHPWVIECPQCFIAGDRPGELAHGKDPYFPPWTDTVQLNAFLPETRARAAQTLLAIAQQCDGVRCDMAMLLLNDVFERTWSHRAGPRPQTEYWTEVIHAVLSSFPNFLFIAEAYWNLEARLRDLGFHFCYDKLLYDRLAHHDAPSIREHLSASVNWQRGLIRFLENHDEPRAASVFPPDRHRAAAVATLTVPGAKLFFDGQFTGHTTKLPVQLRRAPHEDSDAALCAFYSSLLLVARRLSLEGDWTLLEVTGWPDNQSCRNFLAWGWHRGEHRWLVIINYSAHTSQGLLPGALPPGLWKLTGLLGPEVYERSGDTPLYVELPPWAYYLFAIAPM